MIARHQGEFPVRLMCRVLEVGVSGFYAYLKRPPSWRALIDEVLLAHVRIAFAESGETYGAPRVLRELQAEGLPTSTKRVARLMRAEGDLRGVARRPSVSRSDNLYGRWWTLADDDTPVTRCKSTKPASVGRRYAS